MLRLVAVAVFVCGAVQHAACQTRPPSELGRILILEVDLGSDLSRIPTVDLKKGILYWAELVGEGTPVFQPVQGTRRAFIVPIEQRNEPLRFQVSPLQSGPHTITLEDRVPGRSAILRLFEDVVETERLERKRESRVAIGLSVAGGFHTGAAIDSLGGADPRGGSDIEGCLLLQPAGRFGTCLGLGRERFPDARLTVGWLFLEERAVLTHREVFAGRRTDLSVAIRYGKAMGVGSRNVYPALVSLGLQLTQHLAAGSSRRGTSLLWGWQHGWLINAPRSKDRNTDRFFAGVIWLP